MKKLLLLTLFCGVLLSVNAQSTSVYHVETEYTPLNGYRYYFDKINPQTGVSTRLSQLPVIGYFSGYAFFNCFGHYVFQGVDTVTSNGTYINNLYELDTSGNLIRTIPMDTANGTWYKMCWPSAGTSFYYALRWNTSNGQWVIETINAINGSRTIVALTALGNYNYNSSDAAITRNDIIWMGMDDQMSGSTVLLSVNPVNGAVTYEDTLYNSYYYDGLAYDCVNDTIYGFIAHMDSLQGAELFKVNGASGTVIHSGRTAVGSGWFAAGTHTRLADGSYYLKTSNASYLLPDFYVSGPTFIMPPVTGSPLTIACFASPRESCSHYISCTEPNNVSEQPGENALVIFPNPVTNGILNVMQEGYFTVQLIDAQGRVVYSGNGVNTLAVSLNDFTSGIYLIRVEHEGESDLRKVVITN